jgi:anti-anti-sigma factor
MDAKFARCGQVVVVELNGKLDFETSEPFRRTCLEKLISEKVVFDLRNLNFVGSLGLKDFVATMEDMKKSSRPGVKFCGVSSEFRRLFEASGIHAQDMFESQEKALQAFVLSI